MALTFPCQLAVVGLLAGNDLLHQLVVAAVAHCLDDVSHLETHAEMVGTHIHQSRGKTLASCVSEKDLTWGSTSQPW